MPMLFASVTYSLIHEIGFVEKLGALASRSPWNLSSYTIVMPLDIHTVHIVCRRLWHVISSLPTAVYIEYWHSLNRISLQLDHLQSLWQSYRYCDTNTCRPAKQSKRSFRRVTWGVFSYYYYSVSRPIISIAAVVLLYSCLCTVTVLYVSFRAIVKHFVPFCPALLH